MYLLPAQVLIPDVPALAQFAQQLAGLLGGGDRIGLEGGLGAGKTTLTQLLARELGIERGVESPTFILRQSFPVQNHPSITELIHYDFYRLAEQNAFTELGLADDWQNQQSLVVIEWIDRWPALIPDLTYHLRFDWRPDQIERHIWIHPRTGLKGGS